jgi:cytochrome c biogenesis protein
LTGYERWASFQIAFDPGKELALIASALALTGLMLSLFVRRRRIWLKVSSSANGDTVVEIAGLNRTEGGDVSADILMVTEVIVGKEKA